MTRNKVDNIMTMPEVAGAIKVVRDLPDDMTDNEALVLMLAVHCTPDAVGLSVDPPLTGKQVREIIRKYNSYFERMKSKADDILRNILEDSMMIALARVRSALCKVPVKTAASARMLMSIFVELKKLAGEMPKLKEHGVTPAAGDRFAKLAKEFKKLEGVDKEIKETKQDDILDKHLAANKSIEV